MQLCLVLKCKVVCEIGENEPVEGKLGAIEGTQGWTSLIAQDINLV
jgi:hypothetical protein